MRLTLSPWRRTLGAAIAASLVVPPPLWAQTADASATPGMTPQSAAMRSRTPVTLNFVNADVEAVTRAIGAMLDRQILVDPRVKGTITVYSDQPVSIRDAYLNYLSALRGLGFAMVENNGLLKVVPEADAKLQAGGVSVGATGQRGDQIMTQIFRLNYENPNNLVAVLRPLISANNTINANPANGSLVITDYADNLQRLGKIIAALDQPGSTDVEVIPVKQAAAADLAPLVQRLADSSGGAVPGGAPGGAAMGGALSVLPDARSNSLIVRASNPARLAYARSIIDKLDRPTQGGGPAGNIWVVYLKNADATKIAAVLRAAFGGGGGGGSGGSTGGAGGGTSGFGGSGLSQTGIGGTGGPNSLGAGAQGGGLGGASAAATTPVQASAGPSTGGFIQADPSTNSLVITAAEPLYRQIRGVVDQLDSRRAQVAIESMIVEVSGDNAADFGFQWQGLLGKSGDKYGVYGGTNFGTTGNLIGLTTAIAGVGSTTGTGTGSTGTGGVSVGEGLNLGLIRDFGGTYGLAAIARILQSQTNTNIVSTPNLITLDNEEAKIIVGSNVPFITGQFTNTGTATTSPFQTIERKDVGITLRIKPQVGEGGTVRMTIYQESSSLSGSVAPGTSNAGPSTDKRSIESTVVVDDGAILVLGGLIEDRFTENNSKIPLLGDIPYVGALFRSESRTKRRTNLMVFLRPVIMRDGESASRFTMDRYDMIRARQQEAQPAANIMLPISESPVLPPVKSIEETSVPLAVPPTSPGVTRPKPQDPPASGPAN